MTTNDFIKFIIGERIWKDTQIVNHVGVGPRIRVYADGAGVFVLSTADVENLSQSL
jgi:hypothetical protein